jgi:hypothetical protein
MSAPCPTVAIYVAREVIDMKIIISPKSLMDFGVVCFLIGILIVVVLADLAGCTP